jgi:recombination protein RecA
MLKLILAICKRQNTLGIFTGHYYGNPSQYGSPEQVGGGKFAKLAPDIIVAFKNTKIMSEGAKKDQKVIGNRISAITLKNRFYPPFNEGAVEIDYQNGINRLAGMVDLAMQSGYIERNGAWYSNLETGEKFQGSHNAIKCIDNNLLEKMNE